MEIFIKDNFIQDWELVAQSWGLTKDLGMTRKFFYRTQEAYHPRHESCDITWPDWTALRKSRTSLTLECNILTAPYWALSCSDTTREQQKPYHHHLFMYSGKTQEIGPTGLRLPDRGLRLQLYQQRSERFLWLRILQCDRLLFSLPPPLPGNNWQVCREP